MQSLESTFTPVILGDMLSYLHLSLELSARAKGDLLRREMGFPVEPDAELGGQLKELRLELQIGRAGKMALAPLLGQSRRDIWELQQLAEKTGSAERPGSTSSGALTVPIMRYWQRDSQSLRPFEVCQF